MIFFLDAPGQGLSDAHWIVLQISLIFQKRFPDANSS